MISVVKSAGCWKYSLNIVLGGENGFVIHVTRESLGALHTIEGIEMSKQEKGIVLIGENPDSFKRFYEEFRDKILIPAIKSLPTEDELRERMKKAIEESLAKEKSK